MKQSRQLKTIDQVSSKPVVITINTYKYYITEYILHKYFKNCEVDRDEYINVDNYTMTLESFEGIEISASKKLCDVIILEMFESFPGIYIKKIIDVTNDSWPFYFGFIYKYLKVSGDILDHLIEQNPVVANISKHYEALYKCAYKGFAPDSKELWNTVTSTYIRSVRKCNPLFNTMMRKRFDGRDTPSVVENDKVTLKISWNDPTFVVLQVLLTQNKINVLRDFFDSQYVSREYLLYLGIDITAYDNPEPQYGV